MNLPQGVSGRKSAKKTCILTYKEFFICMTNASRTRHFPRPCRPDPAANHRAFAQAGAFRRGNCPGSRAKPASRFASCEDFVRCRARRPPQGRKLGFPCPRGAATCRSALSRTRQLARGRERESLDCGRHGPPCGCTCGSRGGGRTLLCGTCSAMGCDPLAPCCGKRSRSCHGDSLGRSADWTPR